MEAVRIALLLVAAALACAAMRAQRPELAAGVALAAGKPVEVPAPVNGSCVASGEDAVFMHAPRMSDRAMSKSAAICDLRNFMVQTSLACAIMRRRRKFNPRIDKNSSRR